MEADGSRKVKKLCIVENGGFGPKVWLAVESTLVAEEPARMSEKCNPLCSKSIANPGWPRPIKVIPSKLAHMGMLLSAAPVFVTAR